MNVVPRCDVCHKRHVTDRDECPEPGEEGYLTRTELIDAWRLGNGVCLDCQAIWHVSPGERPGVCDWCGQPSEPFTSDDLDG